MTQSGENVEAAAVQALLVIDVQRAFLWGDDAVAGATGLLERVEALTERARGAGCTVVLVQNDGRAGEPDEPGLDGWELALRPGPGDVRVRKSVDDVFVETDLAAQLRSRGITRVAVVGLFSEMCVAASARGAMVHGFDVVLPHDGHHASEVPAWAGVAPAVPEEHTRRVAEWSLGDSVEVVPSTQDVRFGPRAGSGGGYLSPGSERTDA